MHWLRAGITVTGIMDMGIMVTGITAIMGITVITGIGIMVAIGMAVMSTTTLRRSCIASIRCIGPTATTRTRIRLRACLLAGGISALGSVVFRAQQLKRQGAARLAAPTVAIEPAG